MRVPSRRVETSGADIDASSAPKEPSRNPLPNPCPGANGLPTGSVSTKMRTGSAVAQIRRRGGMPVSARVFRDKAAVNTHPSTLRNIHPSSRVLSIGFQFPGGMAATRGTKGEDDGGAAAPRRGE